MGVLTRYRIVSWAEPRPLPAKECRSTVRYREERVIATLPAEVWDRCSRAVGKGSPLESNTDETRRHIDRRAALDAAKRASDVSQGLGRALFAAIARKGAPEISEQQLEEAYEIYLKLTDRTVPLSDSSY